LTGGGSGNRPAHDGKDKDDEQVETGHWRIPGTNWGITAIAHEMRLARRLLGRKSKHEDRVKS
jgi:hypothetical protein